jgi:3-oxoacyl-[acyl-carrier protein] reductase
MSILLVEVARCRVHPSPNVLVVRRSHRRDNPMPTEETVSNSQMLQGKRAVIFGAGGSIGAAVASEFAAEGAQVFLAGRTRSNVEAVAQRIGKAGHRAHAAVIDALDDAAVNTYIDDDEAE